MAESLGIQQLIAAQSVIVKQTRTFLEGNKYVILDANGKLFLRAEEETSFATFFGNSDRSFQMNVRDEQGREVMSFRRPYTYGPDKMDVSLSGRLVSIIRQKHTFVTPVIYINDASDRPILRIKGSRPMAFSGQDIYYDLQAADKTHIGSINRKWRGFVKEAMSYGQGDQFEIQFPGDLDIRFKSAVLGACFLIDFLYYDRKS